jgi:hypothetical protein
VAEELPRSHAYEVPVDTGLFTPLHLQPTAVCRLAFNAAGRWLSEYAISHRILVAEHQTGLVVWSAQLLSGDPVGYFDADRLDLVVTGRVRGGGTQFECDVEVRSPVGRPTRLRACCVPLRLDAGPALAGAPARLSPEVMSAFLADEIETRPHLSPLPALRAAIVCGGTRLAQGRTPFVIHRHQCEVADQWFWPEAISLACTGREELVRAEADEVPRLRLAMKTPVDRLDLLFSRPFYLFDEGAVLSTAYEWEGGLAFIHELVGTERGGDEPRALAIEQFAPAPEPMWD